MPAISAIVLTFNEEKNIGPCLASLQGLADEILVVDSFSSDRTIEIAEKAGARVIQMPWPGYGKAKNQAADLAAGPFLLFLDADEKLSETLKASILKEKNQLAGVYSFNRLNNYCGSWIRHGGFYPDTKIRLYEKSAARWSETPVHETVIPGPGQNVKWLNGDLHHFSYVSVEDHRQRAEKYARLAAEHMMAKNVRPHPLKKYLNAAAKFIRHFLLRLGFLDGAAGFRLAWISAGEVFRKYQLAEHAQMKKG